MRNRKVIQMRTSSRIILAAAVAAAALILAPVTAFADDLTVMPDKESYETGDKVVVTIDTGSTDAVPPDVSVEFPANRLNF